MIGFFAGDHGSLLGSLSFLSHLLFATSGSDDVSAHNPTYVKLYQQIEAKLVASFPEFKVGQEEWPHWLTQGVLDAIWPEIEGLQQDLATSRERSKHLKEILDEETE